MDNKERDPRIEKPFVVRVSEKFSSEQERWDIVTAKNLSASGILFNYRRQLEPGTRLCFRISLPLVDPVECEGEVVRNVEAEWRDAGAVAPPVCAVAAVFHNLSNDDRRILAGFLNQCDPDAPSCIDSKMNRAKRIERSFPFWIQGEEKDSWIPVTMRNISASGVLFACYEPPEAGREKMFRLMLPFLDSPVIGQGHIVRVEDINRPGVEKKIYNVGVEFSKLDDGVQEKLSDYGEEHGVD